MQLKGISGAELAGKMDCFDLPRVKNGLVGLAAQNQHPLRLGRSVFDLIA